MKYSWAQRGMLSILMVAATAGVAFSQESGVRTRQDAENQSPGMIRAEFNELVNNWYPPTLRQVLQLDPSLLRSDEYLKSYPRLADFLRQHPEVANNPTYFVGSPEPQVTVSRYERSNAVRIFEPLAVLSGFLASLVFVTWLIRSFVDHRRWLRVSKLQTDAHSKLLERFGANEDLLRFIETPAGKRFLEFSAIPVEPRITGAPVGRILWSIQVGFVLLFAGIGMEFLSYTQGLDVAVVQALFVVGGLVMAMGVGFLFSGIASYTLSRRFGLFASADGTSATGTSQ